MEFAKPQREQIRRKAVRSEIQKDHAQDTSIQPLPLTLNDAQSPAIRLGHRVGPSRTFLPHPLQAKLTINEPGDQYEQEADRVADQVMRMPDPAIHLQRKCACGNGSGATCSECASQLPSAQRSVATQAETAETAPGIVNEVLGSSGESLDPATRSFMESRFGRDFSEVRIHKDARANKSATTVNALAYTVGPHIVFGRNRYAPESNAGRHLLAHELTHVVQQSSAVSGNGFTIGTTERSQQRQVNPVQGTAGQQRLQRAIAFLDPCRTARPDWRITVSADAGRARTMLGLARRKLYDYAFSGTAPAQVTTMLARHMHTTSRFAAWRLANRALWTATMSYLSGYRCSMSCDPGDLAVAIWCVPLTDIKICEPAYFNDSDIERSTTLIHEWQHKYACALDIGYEHETTPGFLSGYPQTFTGADINADNFSSLIRDLQ